MYLINDNKSIFSIVVPNNATLPEKFAAQELKEYLYKATGAMLPVLTESAACVNIISIGNTAKFNSLNIKLDAEKLNTDGFIIKTVNNNIFINGASSKGVIYGVYEFVERFCGIRFFGYDCIHIPKINDLPLPDADIIEIPDFKIRVYTNDSIKKDQLNCLRQRMEHEMIEFNEEYGGSMGWCTKLGYNHTTLLFVPPKIYFTEQEKEKNAHMYYIKDGVPVDICMTDGITDDGEIDHSVETSAFTAALNTLKSVILESNNKYNYYMFGQMDRQTGCDCPRCRQAEKKYMRSGMNIRFANLLLREAQKFIDKELDGKKIYLIVFAYNYSTDAPVRYNEKGEIQLIDESVRPDKNLYIRLAPIAANFYFSYKEDKHVRNFNKEIQEWGNVASRLMIWIYNTQFLEYFCYFPTLQTWTKNLKFFKSINTEYLLMQSNNDLADWKSLMEVYIASKMLWNIDNDPYKLRDEYIENYYADAAPYVIEFIERFDRHYKKVLNESERDIYMGIYWNKKILLPENMPILLLEKQLETLNIAENAIRQSSKDQQEKKLLIDRLNKVRLTPLYMILYSYDEYYPLNSKEQKKQFIENFVTLCESANVQYIGEGFKFENAKIKMLKEGTVRRQGYSNY